MPKQMADERPAFAVALELKISRERVVRLIQRGALRGRRDEKLGWLVERASADEFRKRQQAVAQLYGTSAA